MNTLSACKKSLIAVFLFLFVSASLLAQANWQKLGSRKVDFKVEKDEIVVGAQEGTFTKLKLLVTSGSLNMHKMVVVYGNGKREEIQLRHNFNAKSTSRLIDLKGNKRAIRKIIFWYDSDLTRKGRATLSVFARS